MRAFAVVVNWNGGEEQNRASLTSLVANGLRPEQIVFVDNASVDGSPEFAEQVFPGLVVLRNDSNEGYGHASNRGIEHALAAGAEVVLLANNDIAMGEGVLDGLVAAFADDPRLGIVGPRVLLSERRDTVWAAGGSLTFRQNLTTLRGHGRPDGPRWQEAVRVDYIAGCAMLVRREVFEQIGFFDGEYFAYHEDVDFCIRASEAGWGILCAGGLVAHHAAHHSTGGGYNPRRKYMMGVNAIWFLRSHGTPWRWLSFLFFDVASLPLVWLLACLRGRGRAVLAKALGMIHGAQGRRVTGATLDGGMGWLW